MILLATALVFFRSCFLGLMATGGRVALFFRMRLIDLVGLCIIGFSLLVFSLFVFKGLPA